MWRPLIKHYCECGFVSNARNAMLRRNSLNEHMKRKGHKEKV